MKERVYLDDDMHVELLGIETDPFIESASLAVIKVHCHINLQIQSSEDVSKDGIFKKQQNKQ